ncbi:MAG: redox-sensing transcriptional repressor Rex [Planctomycetota bacterium]|nr:redox-sensing transcriptional repressor Rex [Planctomycetota bacterium]
MPERSDIPRPTVKRLSLYLREAERRIEAGATTISSRELGESMDIAGTQVRKDLGHFGQIGKSGIGYQASNLVATLRRILGLDRSWRAIVIGVGNIGRALLAYPQFAQRGFHIMAAFDQDLAIVGQELGGIEVRSMDSLIDFVAEQDVHLGLVAVPGEAAQQVAEQLVEAGIKGILNFAPTRLHVPVGVVSVDLSRSLETLAFQVTRGLTGEATADD